MAIPNRHRPSTWTDSMIGYPHADSRMATLRRVSSSHWQKRKKSNRPNQPNQPDKLDQLTRNIRERGIVYWEVDVP